MQIIWIGGRLMRRREFISLISGSAAAWPLTSHGQQADRIRRIGVLSGSAENDPAVQKRLAVFQKSLQTLGWIEGRNIRFDYRWADGSAARMTSYAKELVSSQPDAILALGTNALHPIGKSPSIPIVVTHLSDPVGNGYVTSFSRPGGNVTGFTGADLTIQSKFLPFLKELAPEASRVTIVFGVETNPGNRPALLEKLEAQAKILGMRAEVAHVRDAADLEQTIRAAGKEPGGCLVVLFDIFTYVHRAAIIAMADRYKLPAAYGSRAFAEDGGLLAYGADADEMYRGAADYIDRILKGAKPADLPVQQPTKYELIINVKTAKSLGLTLSPYVLARADEIIE